VARLGELAVTATLVTAASILTAGGTWVMAKISNRKVVAGLEEEIVEGNRKMDSVLRTFKSQNLKMEGIIAEVASLKPSNAADLSSILERHKLSEKQTQNIISRLEKLGIYRSQA
tara:strand:+ start:20081 stop:20425 length:345 start_codon:yes stop_codon:yes gene_type:complete